MDEILKEEFTYEFDHFDSDTALAIGQNCIQYAKEHHLSICLDIYAYSKVMFHYCSDGCSVNNEEFLRKKRNSVLYFGYSTKYLNLKNKNDASLIQTKYGLSLHDYCITPGGFPIRLKNSGLIGSICVSGLSPEEDHACVIEVINHYFCDQNS